MGLFNFNANDDLIFSKEEELLQLKINIVLLMLFVSSVVLAVFSLIRIFKGDLTIAFVDAFGVLICFVLNIYLKRGKKHYNFVSITFIAIITAVVTFALFASGHEIVRSLWYFAILTLAYYLRDGKEGLRWLLLFIALLVWSYTLNDHANLIHYITLIANLVLISAVLYFYDKIKLSEKKDLAEQKEVLEKMVNERTQELHELNTNLQLKVQEEVAKNTIKDKMMVQHSKMAMMGEMIANISHQFRQPLSAINATAGGMKVEMELGLIEAAEAKQKLENIESFVGHLSNTISDFRDFFKEDKEESIINLSQTIDKNLFIIESTLLKNEIKIVKNFDETITVKLLQNELTQSILNILNNAKDALVECVPNTKERFIFIDIKYEDDIPSIIIKDNAGGISEDIMPKIFDDKFTTKEEKDGTGIGLFMTKNMIEDHMKGKIIVSNEEFEYDGKLFKGACFKLRLEQSSVD